MQTISPPVSEESACSYYNSDYQAASSHSDALRKDTGDQPRTDEPEHKVGSGFDKKVPGEWHGELVAELGLQQPVTRKEFRKLAGGQHPVTSEQLIRRVKPREKTDNFGNVKITSEHRAGWDLTFSAPKSISLAALIGGDWRIIQAHKDAVDKSLKETAVFVEARLGNTKPSVRTGKSVCAVFTHDMARPDKKTGYAAPDLHSHAFLFNLTKTEDGKYRSIQPYETFAGQTFTTAIYRSELAVNLKRLGYKIRIDEKTGAPEIEGISRDYIEVSSPRQQEIKETAKSLGIENTKKVAHLNRSKKNFNQAAMRERQMELEMIFGNQAQTVVREARLNQNQLSPKAKSEEQTEKQTKVSQAVDFAIRKAAEKPQQSNWRTIVTAALKKEMGEVIFDEVKNEIELRRQRGHLKDFDLEKRVTRKPAKKETALTNDHAAESIVDKTIIAETAPVNNIIEQTDLESTTKLNEETIKSEVINEHNEITRRTSPRVCAAEENRAAAAAVGADTNQEFYEPIKRAGNSNIAEHTAEHSSGIKFESGRTEVSTTRNGDEPAGITSSEPNSENKRNALERQQLETESIPGRDSESDVSADTQRAGVENDSTEWIGKSIDQQNNPNTGKQSDGTNESISIDPKDIGNNNSDYQFGGSASNQKFDLGNGKQFDADSANIELGDNPIFRSNDGDSGGEGVIEGRKSGVGEGGRTLPGRSRAYGGAAENNFDSSGSGCADDGRDTLCAPTTQTESTADIRRAAEPKAGDAGDDRTSEELVGNILSDTEKPDPARMGETGATKNSRIETAGTDETAAAGTVEEPIAIEIFPAKQSPGKQRSDNTSTTHAGGNTENTENWDRELFSGFDDRTDSACLDGSEGKGNSSKLLQGNEGQKKSDDFGIERGDVHFSGAYFPVSLDTGDSNGNTEGSGAETAGNPKVGEERAENIENEAFLKTEGELPVSLEGTAGSVLADDDNGISADAVRNLYIEHRSDQQLPEQQFSSTDNTDKFLRFTDQDNGISDLGESAELAGAQRNGKRSETGQESERLRVMPVVSDTDDTEHLAADEFLDTAGEQLAMDAFVSDNAAGADCLADSEQSVYSIKKMDEHTQWSILNSHRRELGFPIENHEEESEIIDLTRSLSGTYISEEAANLRRINEEKRTFTDLTDFNDNYADSFRNIEEQFSQIDLHSAEMLQQRLIAAGQQNSEQMKLAAADQLTQQQSALQKPGSLLEAIDDQEDIGAQNNESFQPAGRNFTIVNPSDLLEAKEREFWQKDRQLREAQIAYERAQMRNLMTEDEKAAADQSELEEAEMQELKDDEISRGAVIKL